MKYFKKLICRLFGHKWLYNFTTMPNKAICERCNTKLELNLSTFEWIEIEKFSSDLGTDKEIKKRWASYVR